ncbi:hypothetical protein U9M48_000964 [Paspalum notatum var. saurae]|uniref:Uncharacterized protein n=1 Tax=Paspalum notatum var. saurae TaxID=547442 RepID=A0AAQ3SIJ2_PASNO
MARPRRREDHVLSPLASPGLRIYLWRRADVAVYWMAAQQYSRCAIPSDNPEATLVAFGGIKIPVEIVEVPEIDSMPGVDDDLDGA